MSSIQVLRNLVGAIQEPHERKFFKYPQIPQGIPQGGISEICGLGKSEFIMRLMLENPQIKLAWVEGCISLNPWAVVQKGVECQRLLFIETIHESIWVLLQLIQSQLFPVVVWNKGNSSKPFDERSLRRLQLACEKSGSSLILLSEHFQNSWSVKMQCEVQRIGQSNELQVNIKKGAYL